MSAPTRRPDRRTSSPADSSPAELHLVRLCTPGPGKRSPQGWPGLVTEIARREHLSEVQVLRRSGLSTATLCNLLAGVSPLRVHQATALVSAGFDLGDLLAAAGVTVPGGLCGRLTRRRWELDWTVTTLVERSTISCTTIVAVEDGVLPRALTAARLAHALDVDLGEVITAYPHTGNVPFGPALRDRMLHRFWALGDVATAVDLPYMQVRQWLVGDEVPGPGTLDRLIAAISDPDGRLRIAGRH